MPDNTICFKQENKRPKLNCPILADEVKAPFGQTAEDTHSDSAAFIQIDVSHGSNLHAS